MNTKLAITVLLIGIVSAGFASQALAQSRVPGVKTGDYFVYTAVAAWTSNNSSAIMPPGLSLYNDTDQYRVQVSGAFGVNATATYVWGLKNGTEIPFLLTQDVESGESFYHSYNKPPFEVLVGANMNAGDVLHPTGNDTYAINQTSTRDYAGGTRETLIIEVVYPIQNNETDATVVGSTTDRFLVDRATGVIVQQEAIIERTADPTEKLQVTWTLKETNLWDASPAVTVTNTTIIVAGVAVVIVVVILVAVYFLRKGKSSKSRR